MFSSGALGCFTLKVRHGWHLSMCFLACALPCKARRSGCILGPACTVQDPNGQLHYGTLSEQFPLCAAGRTSWNRASWDSLGRILLYRMPHFNLRVVALLKEMSIVQEKSVVWSWHWPRVPPCSLTITRLKTRSAH